MPLEQRPQLGSCLCGAVRFAISGPLRDVVSCHCGQCRRSHGHFSAFTAAAWDSIAFESEDGLAWFRSSAGARRGFCNRCGSSLFWELDGDPVLRIAAGSLESPTGLTTVRHIFVNDKGDYYSRSTTMCLRSRDRCWSVNVPCARKNAIRCASISSAGNAVSASSRFVRATVGRPTPGMQPSLVLPDGGSADAINVLILKREPHEYTARFQHIVRRTHDPKERLDEALKELSAAYYQRPYEFAEVMTALFALDSVLAKKLIEYGECELAFEQFSQRYDLPCTVHRCWMRAIPDSWRRMHIISMFNPTLPGNVLIASFTPDWTRGSAVPPIEPVR